MVFWYRKNYVVNSAEGGGGRDGRFMSMVSRNMVWAEGNSAPKKGVGKYFPNLWHPSGYGDVPCTWPGKALTMLFSCTGVPLTLICLAHLGRILRKVADKIWHDCILKKSAAIEANVYKDRDRLPLYVAITMTIFWILLTSVYFHCFLVFHPETIPSSWSYFDAFYFTVVSLFTISFRDYAPISNELVLLTFPIIFVSQALVSMCVAVVQKRMKSHVEELHKLMMQQAYKAADKAYFTEREKKVLAKVISKFPIFVNFILPF
ncbi:MAG: two pore domain potassium channel family protein [Gammaproteobacteria bacterium]|nr:two pore domain potassium channel family protein [Gammaproteobacteria bacterium]